MLTQASLYALEKALNKTLKLDPDITAKMAVFSGKKFRIIILPLNVSLCFEFSNDKLHINNDKHGEVDTTITSSPLGLIRLSLLPSNRVRSLFNDKIKIKGDVELGQQLKQFFDEFDIDWEGHLALFTGDVVAHQMANIAHSIKGFARNTKQSMQNNVTEYLQQELRQLPCQEEVEDFMRDIDKLRLDVDRLQAQVEKR